ncbi:dienelactone hydrolase [Sporomusaceae bacterium BoRhaA]|uniref:alpha/beta hydrolase family protein n=1 Tax=Pelorhabdus rhamnosifermentans TaxID=2772457 RepID=UPI001C062D8D|nr:hypothetical protein [Pelorhabdus rhamnosifermentans]MBU2700439.1 dienelactone hydrolase [Pelorhabdus rhamnosifermentans]
MVKRITVAVVCFIVFCYMPVISAKEVAYNPFIAAKGQYEIGTTFFTWTPTGQAEQYVGQIWYPANKGPKSKRAYYLPDNTYQFVQKDPAYSKLKNFPTDAIVDASMLKKGKPYPALIFSPGQGLIRQQNTFMFEYLASRGFIIIAVDHPGSSVLAEKADGSFTSYDHAYDDSALEGQLTEERGRQLSTVLDTILKLNSDPSSKIYESVDTNKIGVFGHSLGGRTALRACSQDKRFKAALDLDGSLEGEKSYSFSNQEILMVSADIEERLEKAENYKQSKKEYSAVMDNLMLSPNAKKYLIYYKGTEHANFCDLGLLLNKELSSAVGPADAQTVLLSLSALANDYFHGVFSEKGSTLVKTNFQYPYTELIRLENDLTK